MKNRDAILGKISNIRNCLLSIRNVTGMDPVALTDQIKQDVFATLPFMTTSNLM